MINPLSTTPVSEDFFPEIRRKVSDYFSQNGISRYANRLFWNKALVYTALMAGGYVFLVMFGSVSSGNLWTGYLIYLISAGLLVVTVAHDASHHAVSRQRWVNQLLSYSWNLVGMSRHIWEAKHHESHHVHTNLPFLDVDIPENPVIRFNQSYQWRPWFRYQHLYAPLLFLLYGPFQVFVKDFILCIHSRHKFRDTQLKNAGFPVKLAITKLVFLTYSLIIPWLLTGIPFLAILGVYLSCLSITGFLFVLVLAIPHMNEYGTWQGPVPDVRSRDNWALLQVRTTVDSSPHSSLLAWLTGGLHTHLAHHLFPHFCHIHYMAITRIIRKTLRKRGIRYVSLSFGQLLLSHFRFLRNNGREPVALPVLEVVTSS